MEKGMLGKREYTRKGELVQRTLYTYMELSQTSTLVLLMYSNKNV
jgi:hypothetical protein